MFLFSTFFSEGIPMKIYFLKSHADVFNWRYFMRSYSSSAGSRQGCRMTQGLAQTLHSVINVWPSVDHYFLWTLAASWSYVGMNTGRHFFLAQPVVLRSHIFSSQLDSILNWSSSFFVWVHPSLSYFCELQHYHSHLRIYCQEFGTWTQHKICLQCMFVE